jgi:hypothetical protein
MPTIDTNAAPAPVAPVLPVIIHLPPDLLAALQREDSNRANWQGVDPDAFDGFDDSSPEGGLK